MTPEARLRRIVAANRARQERHARYLRGERSEKATAALSAATERLLAEVRAGRAEAEALRLQARAMKDPDVRTALHRQADQLSLRSMARASGVSVETISQMLRAADRKAAGLAPWPRPKHKRKTLVYVP